MIVGPHNNIKFLGNHMTNVVWTAFYLAQFFRLRQISIPANQAQLVHAMPFEKSHSTIQNVTDKNVATQSYLGSNKDEFTSPSPFLISCITSKMSCLMVAYSPMIHKAWRWILQESKFKFHIVNELGINNNDILTYCNNEVATSQYAPYIDIQYVTIE